MLIVIILFHLSDDHRFGVLYRSNLNELTNPFKFIFEKTSETNSFLS